MATLALAFSVATAQASSVNVIWQGSGTATTLVPTSTVSVTGNIVLTIGAGDSQMGGGGGGAVIELSADSTGGVTITGHSQTTLTGWINLGPSPPADPHSENVQSQGDLLGYGQIVLPGASVIIGTITVHVNGGASGTVTVSNSGGADVIFGNSVTDITGQFTWGAGTVIIPEPTTASLLGLGLFGLTVAGRRRKS
jgi:hypothetical protein